MQESTEVASLVDNVSRFPTAKCLVNWDKSNTVVTWFRCDEPNVDRGYLVTDILYAEDETPEGIITEVDNVKYIDESEYLMTAEGLDELYGDDYQSVSSECDIKLSNTTDRYTPQDSVNVIIRNPGFESYGLFGWNVLASGNGDIIETSDGQYDGDTCMKVQNIAHTVNTGIYCDSYFIGSGNRIISSGASYIGSIYASGSGTMYLRVNITDSGDTVLDYSEDSFVLDNTYQRCYVPLDINETSEGRDRKINMQVTVSGDVAYFDDAMITLNNNSPFIDYFDYINIAALEAVYTKNANTTDEMNAGYAGITGGTELIRNGSFEEGSSFNTRHDGYSATQGDGIMSVHIDSDVKFDGSHSKRIDTTSTNSSAVQDGTYCVIPPNTHLYFSGYMKTQGLRSDDAGDSSYFKLNEYDANWNLIATGTNLYLGSTHDWTEQLYDWTTDASAKYSNIYFHAGKVDSGTGSTWFDKLRLSTSPTDYDVKGGLQKTTGDYSDCTYQAKLQSIWTPTQYNACDATTDWIVVRGDAPAIDTSDKKEGTGSLVFNKTTAVNASSYARYAPNTSIDFSSLDYISFDFKTPSTADLAKINYLDVYLTTGAFLNYLHYIVDKKLFPLGETWYRITINKNSFTGRTGTYNPTDTDGIQFSVFTNRASDTLGNMKLDNISFQNIRGIEQGVYARATDENNCYRFIAKDQNTIALQKLVSGIVTDLATATYDTTVSQAYYFGMKCKGDEIEGYISTSKIDFNTDTPVLVTTDSTYTTGKIGIFNNVTHSHIDELRVNDYESEAFDNDFIGEFIKPKRIIRVNTGFKEKPNDLSGSDVIQFTGVSEQITPNIRDDVADIHCLDFSVELKDTTATPNMYVDQTASDLIKILAYQAGLTDDQMIIEESYHVVRFAWFQEGSIWYYMQMLAEAEGGRIFFDKQGVLRFWSKNHDAMDNTIDRVFDFDDISNLSYNVSSQKMKNRIIVKSLPRQVCDFQRVYTHATADKISPGETITIWANINDEENRDLPCLSLAEPVANTTGTSNYRANSQSDGEGTDLSNLITVTSWYGFGKDAKMIFYNGSSQEAYITKLEIFGIPARVIDNGIEVIREDTDLLDEFGVQELQIENNFIDDEYFAESLADFRLDELKDPTKFIDIDVVGDVRLEPGDKISCQTDYDGNYDTFKIVRNRWQLVDDFVQALTLEKVFIDSWFTADQSIADGFDICIY
jgi:hypothetical protein